MLVLGGGRADEGSHRQESTTGAEPRSRPKPLVADNRATDDRAADDRAADDQAADDQAADNRAANDQAADDQAADS